MGYDEIFNKYNDAYVSNDYYLKLIGNTIYVMTKRKWARKSRCVFYLVMCHPNFTNNTMLYILDYYGFQKRKEVKDNE